MTIRLEWDADKAAANIRKHGLSFETAASVFADPFALALQDRFEGGEHRWQTIGAIQGELIVLVAHTVRETGGNEVIRIVSARKADRKERKLYAEQSR
jgi:uncharacterized protein